MERSQTIGELAKALNDFQASVGAIGRDATNPFFKSRYATLENIVNTIRAPLYKAGLSFSQFPTGDNELVTIVMHTSGEFLQATAKMTPKDSSPQAQGSAITYLRRYALAAVLGLATEEDDDGNAATHQKPPQKAYTPGSAKKTPKAEVADVDQDTAGLEALAALEGKGGDEVVVEGLPDDPPFWVCQDCGTEITKAEHEYSLRFLGRPLCRDDQKKAKEAKGK